MPWFLSYSEIFFTEVLAFRQNSEKKTRIITIIRTPITEFVYTTNTFLFLIIFLFSLPSFLFHVYISAVSHFPHFSVSQQVFHLPFESWHDIILQWFIASLHVIAIIMTMGWKFTTVDNLVIFLVLMSFCDVCVWYKIVSEIKYDQVIEWRSHSDWLCKMFHCHRLIVKLLLECHCCQEKCHLEMWHFSSLLLMTGLILW